MLSDNEKMFQKPQQRFESFELAIKTYLSVH